MYVETDKVSGAWLCVSKYSIPGSSVSLFHRFLFLSWLVLPHPASCWMPVHVLSVRTLHLLLLQHHPIRILVSLWFVCMQKQTRYTGPWLCVSKYSIPGSSVSLFHRCLFLSWLVIPHPASCWMPVRVLSVCTLHLLLLQHHPIHILVSFWFVCM